jgi:hypothetical protein
MPKKRGDFPKMKTISEEAEEGRRRGEESRKQEAGRGRKGSKGSKSPFFGMSGLDGNRMSIEH